MIIDEEITICQLFCNNLNDINECLKNIHKYKTELDNMKKYSESQLKQLNDMCDNCESKLKKGITFNKNKLIQLKDTSKFLNNIMRETIYSNKIITERDLIIEIKYTLNNILNNSDDKEFKVNNEDLTKHLNVIKHKNIIYHSFILKKMIYGGNHKKKQCTICYSDDSDFIVITKCDHYFCEECLYKSINMFYNDRFILKDTSNKPKCPMCRDLF